ncbi:HPr family phosphocarrier protein [Niallia sp. MER 6]|uniref:HPr family phosphocarrier protein n=1 Tax=Niallia sp. MER 6 TaxID=2939567 RepID=UPI002041FC8F|nr:HPr family phosphocarrier protein [Niallia sp. MER 6]MCM3033543.1 HPr family phosphocarrier protein [Niallia sp. MER 6]
MLRSQVIVNLPRGLQARNTCYFVAIASMFDCKIHIIYKGVTSGIDLMDIMNLNVLEKDEIILVANGKDEQKAISTLEKFFNEGKLDNNSLIIP